MRKKFDDLVAKIDELDEADLIRNADGFSFDIGLFKRKLYNSESWTQVIIAHLYVDHVLNEMLSLALSNPTALNFTRMGFSQKVALCVALGTIDTDISHSLNVINSVRNSLAHSLKFEITNDEARQLAKSLPNGISDALLDLTRTPVEWPVEKRRILRCLSIIVMFLEVQRGIYLKNRLVESKRRRNLEIALDELKRFDEERAATDGQNLE
jgi:hypothetical protein